MGWREGLAVKNWLLRGHWAAEMLEWVKVTEPNNLNSIPGPRGQKRTNFQRLSSHLHTTVTACEHKDTQTMHTTYTKHHTTYIEYNKILLLKNSNRKKSRKSKNL